MAWLNPARARQGWRSLNVAGGNGRHAFRIYEASQRQADVTVLDIKWRDARSRPRTRPKTRHSARRMTFVEANAETALRGCEYSTPIRSLSASATCPAHRDGAGRSPSGSQDGPTGRFMCLEFLTEVEMPLLDKAYEAWSFHAIPRIGAGSSRRWRTLPVIRGVDP